MSFRVVCGPLDKPVWADWYVPETASRAVIEEVARDMGEHYGQHLRLLCTSRGLRHVKWLIDALCARMLTMR